MIRQVTTSYWMKRHDARINAIKAMSAEPQSNCSCVTCGSCTSDILGTGKDWSTMVVRVELRNDVRRRLQCSRVGRAKSRDHTFNKFGVLPGSLDPQLRTLRTNSMTHSNGRKYSHRQGRTSE